MPTCLKHQQIYNMNEYCIYCGPVETETRTNFPKEKTLEDLSLEEVKRMLKDFSESHAPKPMPIPSIFQVPMPTTLKSKLFILWERSLWFALP